MTLRHKPKQPRLILSTLALATLAMLDQAAAQTAPAAPAPETNRLDRVEVTGSIIRRLADEEALPVTLIRADTLKQRGQTELKDLMLELPQAAGLGTNSGSAGPLLSLRGFGAPRTLVLLDGRRMPLEPFRDQYVPLTVMPQIALDRVEILRDGASSSYGSDAMAGVTNFITKKTFQGGFLLGQAILPERGGGGGTQREGFMYGLGDLNKDGWNVYGAFEHSKRSILYAKDRPELIASDALTALGIPNAITNNPTAGTPANITNAGANKATAQNPYYATGCLGLGLPGASGANQRCYYDYRNGVEAYTQGFDNYNLFLKGTYRFNADHQLTVQFNDAQVLTAFDRGTNGGGVSKAVYKYFNGATSGTTVNMTLPATSKYYPGNGIVPAVAGVTGQALNLDWGIVELGTQHRDDYQYNRRLVLTDEGRMGDWDYRFGFNHGTNVRVPYFGAGFVSESGLQKGLNSGVLNPFGLQDQAGRDYLASISMANTVSRWVYSWNRGVDFTASRELMQLAGGPLTLAVGGEFRRDQFRAKGNDGAADILNETPFLSTIQPGLPIVSPNGTQNSAFKPYDSAAHRNIVSAYAEVEVPWTKELTLNAALRGDKYQDAGEGNYAASTINPKISFRYTPSKGLMFRGSANTGFRAPSLVELYQALTELKTDQKFDDPVLCPGGKLGINGSLGYIGGTAVPNLPAGVTATDVCNANLPYATQLPKNSTLKEETSRNYTFGVALEPLPGVTMTFDYWNMYIKNVISPPVLATTLANPTQYASLYVRNPNGTLAYVLNTNGNLGGLIADGIDGSVNWTGQRGDWGRFRAGLDFTYLMKWASQVVQGGPWLDQLGIFNPGVDPNTGISTKPQLNYRWKYTASLGWDFGPWSSTLSQRYNGSYVDQNTRAGAPYHQIEPYSQFNLTTSYTGIKNLKLTLGINNLFNVNPPLTNHVNYDGYLTTNADVLGRAYNLSAEYTF